MIQFGTGGWRAVIGDEFTKENVRRVAQALADHMSSSGLAKDGLALGYDRRFLSRQAAEWAAEVLSAWDIPVRFIGYAAPTPLVMYTVKRFELPFGMMVTASHNPAIYNGIKIFTAGGRDADQIFTGALADAANEISADDIRSIPFEKAVQRSKVLLIDPQNDYIDDIMSLLDLQKIRDRHLSVVIDPMYGVSRTPLLTVLASARCRVSLIHEQHDALFGGRLPAPEASTLGSLCSAVKDSDADIGLATDGDADRLGVVDEKGAFVPFNKVLALLYYYLLKYKGLRGGVVRNLVTTHMLDEVAHAFGEKCFEVPVGFKHISAAMSEHDALLGGESSGGLTVRGYISGKDGVYAASLMVEMLALTGKKVSQLISDLERQFGKYQMVEHDYAFDPADKEKLSHALLVERKLPAFSEEVLRIDCMDGLKVAFKNGWVSARFSGTEPRLRVFSEMPSKAKAEAMCHAMSDFLGLSE